MPCYYPLEGYSSATPNENGNYPVVFSRKGAQQDNPITLPCGRCHGCRLESSKQWAIRCLHESQLHDENSFITLTFNDENLPLDKSIDKKHWQAFMKALRQQLAPKKIRFYACGEYGEEIDEYGVKQLGRPHYHAIIFGHEWTDKKLHDVHNGNKIYSSENLDKLWGKGFCTIGDVTFESAGYVARYIMKKIGGELAYDHYQKLNPETGEVFLLQPEFTLQSRRPGIGQLWLKKYKQDLNKGFLTINGSKVAIPQYYMRQLKNEPDNLMYSELKEMQRITCDFDSPEFKIERLRIKEKVKLSRTKNLIRALK